MAACKVSFAGCPYSFKGNDWGSLIFFDIADKGLYVARITKVDEVYIY